MNKKNDDSTIAINKKAKFNFELFDFIEAGIVLKGSEVKSLREKNANLTDAFAQIKNGEPVLQNLNITPYINGGYSNHIDIRPRKLLLNKKEIFKLQKEVKEKGLVLVAIKVYFKDNKYVKVQLALGKPKKLFDKRETMKKRDAQIEINRNFKSRY